MTALITGASSGIGACFAEKLAGRGHDLVLVARDADRLERNAAELRSRYSIDIEVLPADLATDADTARVEQRLAQRGRPVDVLVNNAGFGLGVDVVHSNVDDEEQLLRVMVRAPMRLTKAALPGMLERRSGSIITVSSVAGIIAANSYGAAKSWALKFSESLSLQLHGTGVRAIALCPGLVHTEFHQRGNVDASAAPSFMWLTADRVVEECLRALDRGKTVCIPSRRYRVLVGMGRHLPASLTGRIAQSRGRLPRRQR